MTHRFDRDTAVTPAGDGAFDVCIDSGWWVHAAPNGGYLAALVLRALQAAVDAAERAPRSLTLHYTAAPTAGPARVQTTIERTGRSLTTATARLHQDGRLCVLATGAFSRPRERSLDRTELHMPRVPRPGRCPPFPSRIPIHDRFEHRWALGAPPWGGGKEALAGGWIRLREPRVVDAPVVAAYTDAFPPALFSTFAPGSPAGAIPTVDLTIHFRTPLPLAGAAADAFTLAVFRSRFARDGFVEEDGEIWSRDGELLAQSRQLALLTLLRDGEPGPRPEPGPPPDLRRLSRNGGVGWLSRLRRRR